MEHLDCPHDPGQLYDCPACEASCYCDPEDTTTNECVYHALLREWRMNNDPD